jgi:hypothetical protein
MFAFGCAIASERDYSRYALRGIRRAGEPDSVVVERRGQSCIFRAYNSMIDEVRDLADLEALVLLHEDTEIGSSDFATRVRGLFVDPLVAVVGAIGGIDVFSLAWWDGAGRGRVAAPRIERRAGILSDSGVAAGEVDAVDGLILVLSPWAVRQLRFDESLGPGFHGYDVDICFQARAMGRRVVVDDLGAIHHAARGFTSMHEEWIRADVAFRRKWERSSLMQRTLARI